MTAIETTDTGIRARAAAWTAGIHILLILLFMLLRYSLPARQPLEELGMEVNLGTDPDGSGADQPMAVDDPAADRSERRFETGRARHTGGLPDMERSDDPDAPEIGAVSNTRSKDNNAQAIARDRNGKDQRPRENTKTRPPRYVYSGGTGNGGNRAAADQAGAGEGNTTGNGDRGVPGGTPGASDYEGSPGNGTGGISHNLGGRTISPSRFEAEFHEGGKVVVSVTVNREGTILDARIKSSSNPKLSQIALQKIHQAKFSKSQSSAPQAFGEVTIIFKARS